MSLGRRWRCSAGENTFAPYTWLAGAVRSTAPMDEPFAFHCAAVTFG
jgi:hypothetical protein